MPSLPKNLTLILGEGEGNDMVFDGDSLDWDTVYESSDIGESNTYTKSRSKKRKETSTSSSSRKASRTASISRKEKKLLPHYDDDFIF